MVFLTFPRGSKLCFTFAFESVFDPGQCRRFSPPALIKHDVYAVYGDRTNPRTSTQLRQGAVRAKHIPWIRDEV